MLSLSTLKSPLARASIALTLAMLLLSSNVLPPAHAAAGDLDPSFGSGGKVTTDFSNSSDRSAAIAIQSDGKAVVAGSTVINISTQHDFALARYNSDGSLDASFGEGGKVKTDFFGLGDEAHAIAVQGDGKIIAAGISGIGTSDVVFEFNPDFALARYNSDGSLDASFGVGGKVTTDFFGFKDQIFAIALQSDGKIVAVGYASFFSVFGLARYNSDGSLDTSFGTGGKITTSFGDFSNFAHGVVIQSNGKIVVSGTAFINGFFAFALARYNSDGSLDASFGSEGKVTTDFGLRDDQSFAIALQTDGKIVVAGAADFFNKFGLARYNSDGSLDTSFGIGGKVTTAFLDASFAFAQANALIIQSNGKIIAAGAALNPGTFGDFALARYNSDGSLDASFGVGGKVTTDFFGFGDQIFAAALQGDGKIIVAGSATGVNLDFTLARYDGDGKSFDFCLQDDRNGNLFQFDSATGDYQFLNCRKQITLIGRGMVSTRFCKVELQDVKRDRNISVLANICTHAGTASVQDFSRNQTFTISDRNIFNNTCACR
jgi:uncharacterized delta-60 repeat protein